MLEYEPHSPQSTEILDEYNQILIFLAAIKPIWDCNNPSHGVIKDLFVSARQLQVEQRHRYANMESSQRLMQQAKIRFGLKSEWR